MAVMTATQVKKLKCPDGAKLKAFSIDNTCSLYLVCFASGTRLFKKRLKSGYATLGDIDDISLAQAREKAINFTQIQKISNRQTIKQVFDKWLNIKLSDTEENSQKRRKILNRVNKHLLEPLGSKFIDEVDKQAIVKATIGISFESAKRILAIYRDMLKFARNMGYIDEISFIYEIIDDKNVLYKKEAVKHRKAINDKERLREILEIVSGSNMNENLKNLFYFNLLTAQRPHQIRELEWDRVDGEFIYFKESDNKTKINARIPLSSLAKEILERQKALFGSEGLVFKSSNWSKRSGWAISDTTIMQSLKRLGINDLHMHGIRGTFATFAIRESEMIDGIYRGKFEKRRFHIHDRWQCDRLCLHRA